MTDIKEKILALDAAWKSKDEAKLREILHDDYQFTGPFMSFNGVDQAVFAMKFFPFVAESENREIIVEGHKAAHAFDWVVSAPFQGTISIVELLEFEGEKLKKGRMIFDTKQFPAEVMAMFPG